jgi:hypothetical protein
MENKEAIDSVRRFGGESLPKAVAAIQKNASKLHKAGIQSLLNQSDITPAILHSAFAVKRLAGQINEVVHAVGIFIALPSTMVRGEEVVEVSLAAGNTGQQFDLVATHRVADFTFITWKGGPEVIRQNKIFKDFFFLAEEPTEKVKELYVLGPELPLKFFASNRALPPILKGNAKLGRRFAEVYADARFETVSDYFRVKQDIVRIRDVTPFLPSELS